MKAHDHFRRILKAETAHLVGRERAILVEMCADACVFAQECQNVTVEALTVKLLTLYEGSERWVRILVAQAAIEAERLAVAA